MLKRWISRIVLVAMLANLAGWPIASIAEMLQHGCESSAPEVERKELPGKPCTHCCACHFNQHMQWQPPVSSVFLREHGTEGVRPVADPAVPSQPTAPPFRPPRP